MIFWSIRAWRIASQTLAVIHHAGLAAGGLDQRRRGQHPGLNGWSGCGMTAA
jgi:hypothetical protein